MADDSRLSSVIDEDGNLFGVVNVVDALVVLLIVAVAVAGVALLFPGGGGTETRYVTIELGAQPDHVVSQISAGQDADLVINPESQTEATTAEEVLQITDVYLFPAPSGEDGETTGGVNVVVRAEVSGSAITEAEGEANTISVGGSPLRFGQTLQVDALEYSASGTVTDISRNSERIGTEQRSFVVQSTVSRRLAENIQTGDTYQLGEQPLITIESVSVYQTNEEDMRRVVLGVTADAQVSGTTAFVGDQPLRNGEDITLQTNTYDLTGEIIRLGSLEEPGTPTTRTLTVEVPQISPTVANALQSGLTEQIGDTVTAEIQSIETQPAERVLQSNGEFVVREHPRDLEATMQITAAVREQQDGTLRYRGQPLNLDTTLTFNFGTVMVDGDIQNIEQ